MKQIFYLIIVIILCIGISSCKKEGLALFDDESSSNSIYFERNVMASAPYISIEPVFVGFGYFSAMKQDSLVKIVVKTTGAKHTSDRPYTLIISDTSSMKKDVDYEILNTVYAIKAGRLTDTIQLRLKRSAMMKDKKIQLGFDLQPNEHFSNAMLSRWSGIGTDQNAGFYTKLSVEADDIVGIPNFWNAAIVSTVTTRVYPNLGLYSAKKLLLIIELFGLDTKVILSPTYVMDNSTAVVIGKSFKAYLLEKQANGTPVLEENGSLMKANL